MAPDASISQVHFQKRVYELALSDVDQGSAEKVTLQFGNNVGEDNDEARMDLLPSVKSDEVDRSAQ